MCTIFCGSPRVWGSHQPVPVPASEPRFIPTCVGLTSAPPLSELPERFIPTCVGLTQSWHCIRPPMGGSSPRAWGYRRISLFSRRISGSSPRAWGYLLPVFVGRPVSRFIPTCVGLSARQIPRWCPRSVHPHVSGGIAPATVQLMPRLGSSPRAWGYLGQGAAFRLNVRFIPTCVGLTYRPAAWRRRDTVQPHVRGVIQGSRCSVYRRTVHPHVRGVISVNSRCTRPMYGSSPRAWGYHLKIVANYSIFTNCIPSRSTIDRFGVPASIMVIPCSLLLEYTITAPSAELVVHTRSHSSSRDGNSTILADSHN